MNRSFAIPEALLHRPWVLWLVCWSVGGGVALFSFAPFGWWPLLMVGLAWLFRTLARAAYLRDAAAASGFFAHGYFTVGLSWLAVALARYGGLPWGVAAVAVALLAAYLALWWAIAGGITHWLWRRLGTVRALVPAALWTLAEWGRGGLLTGFPWLMPGFAAAHDAGPLALFNGWFPIVGALGVTFLMVALAAAWGNAPRRLQTWGITFGVCVAGWGLGQIAWSEPAAPPVTVSVIQTVVAQDEKWDTRRWQTHFTELTRKVARAKGAVVVTPETVLPLFESDLPQTWRAALVAAFAQGNDAHAPDASNRTLLLGLFRRDATGIHNALTTLDGRWHYDKRQLVPFGEFVPPGFHWFVRWLAIPFADQVPGVANPSLGAWQRAHWAANICYESAFARWVVRDVRRGAQILVNASNFAWYGKTHGQWQHAQIGRARALETARPWIQAVNAGVSAVFDAQGRTVAIAAPWRDAVLDAVIVPQQGLTPFVRWGGEASVVFLALALLGAVLSRRGRNRVRC